MTVMQRYSSIGVMIVTVVTDESVAGTGEDRELLLANW
jgi:hypothetical protein